jgi:hypothetical protein
MRIRAVTPSLRPLSTDSFVNSRKRPASGEVKVMDLDESFGLLPFTYKQARDAGVSDRQFRAAKNQLVLVRRGVYAVRWASDAKTRHCQRVAALLLTKTDHFAMGMSAVAILGLPDPPHFTWDTYSPQIGAKKTRTARGIRKSSAVPIPTQWGDCTDAVTTAVHIAGEAELPEALMVTDAVARLLADTNDRIVLASQECRERVRRILTEEQDLPALALANPAADSPAESFCRGHMINRGFVDPACGTPLVDAKGNQRFIDLLLELFAVEVDGRGKYKDPGVAAAEKVREHNLRLAHGLWFHRIWVDDLYADPVSVIDAMAKEEAEVRLMRGLTG